jgi:hypothetical protein
VTNGSNISHCSPRADFDESIKRRGFSFLRRRIEGRTETISRFAPSGLVEKMQGALVSRFREEISTRFHAGENWIILDEFPVDSGRNGKGRIDLLAILCDRRRAIKRVAYEIKIDRGDFLQERRQPKKRKRVYGICDQFYFAVPKGLVGLHEVPRECGLIEVSEDFSIGGITKGAAKLASPEPSPAFIRDVARRNYQIGLRHGAVSCVSQLFDVLLEMANIPTPNKASAAKHTDIVRQISDVLRKMQCHPESENFARIAEGATPLMNGRALRRCLRGWKFSRRRCAIPLTDLYLDSTKLPDDLNIEGFADY